MVDIEVGAVGNLELAPRIARETELVLDVGPLGVVRQLFLRMFEQPQILGIDTEFDVPVETLVDPVLMPLFVVAGFDEEFICSNCGRGR